MTFDKLDAARAIDSCEAALKAHPDSARFGFQLGRAYERARRFQDAARGSLTKLRGLLAHSEN